jgi:hypothetical protein
VQRNKIDLSFSLIDLSLYLAAILTGIKKAGFMELRLKVSKKKLTLKINFKEGTDCAHMSLLNEDIS